MKEPIDPKQLLQDLHEIVNAMEDSRKAIRTAIQAQREHRMALEEFKRVKSQLETHFSVTQAAAAFVLNPLSWIVAKVTSIYRRLFKKD